jgi:hypothetical protein
MCPDLQSVTISSLAAALNRIVETVPDMTHPFWHLPDAARGF